MQARDATGRPVSLLNDESYYAPLPPLHAHSSSYAAHSNPTPGSSSSSPNLNSPQLLRSDSCDSQMTLDPKSPMTPGLDFYPRHSLYAIPHDYGLEAPSSKRPSYADSSRSASFDDNASATSSLPERPPKRYPCRYRDTHGCEKTFTTSGHASRHSKIHTAEKAVPCTYPGCQKKFTRADNMKQHLETHYKDKSRSSSGQRAHKPAPADSRRGSSSGRSSGPRATSHRDARSHWDTEPYPLPSPHCAAGVWDMHARNLPSLNRPVTGRTPSGLDALAMAIACKEQENAY